MKLDTKEQHLRDQLGLMIDYTPEELKILRTKHISVIDQSIEYIAEFLTARDTPHHATLANWIEA